MALRLLLAIATMFVALAPVILQAQSVSLSTFEPVDAQYGLPLDKIIMVSADPNVLHIYDPAVNEDTTVPLASTPLGVSVSPDGYHAAVMHNQAVSYVNLQTPAGVQQTFVTTAAADKSCFLLTISTFCPRPQEMRFRSSCRMAHRH